jgi:hypothetical protein
MAGWMVIIGVRMGYAPSFPFFTALYTSNQIILPKPAIKQINRFIGDNAEKVKRPLRGGK